MRPTNRAFTLIELLVVIAVIALLAALLFPVFSRARDKDGKPRASPTKDRLDWRRHSTSPITTNITLLDIHPPLIL